MIGLATAAVLALLSPATQGIAATVLLTGVLLALLGAATMWDLRQCSADPAAPCPADPIVTVMTDAAGDTYPDVVLADRAATAIAALTPTMAACGGPAGCLCQARDRDVYDRYADVVDAEYARDAERLAAEATAHLTLGLLPREREAGDA